MSSSEVTDPPEVAEVLDALDAAVARVGELGLDTYEPAVRLRALERVETARRQQAVTSHDIIAGLAKEDAADIGGPVHKVVADWLRITCAEARRRLRNAEQLSPRTTLTGQPLPPELPATAQVWREGQLDEQHLRVIQTLIRDLPQDIPANIVEHAEQFLAEQATQLRPDQLEKVANRYAITINPDGKFSDEDRARQRSFSWGPQRRDGMSIGKLTATPELRANLDAWFARFAAPGMCNPDDQTACVTGQPADDVAAKDLRGHAQRQHDALNALVRGQLGDPKLGVHNGLPVTVIVSTTLAELTAGTGHAVTGGGTLLPMRDVIRMASHAHHYLIVTWNQTACRSAGAGPWPSSVTAELKSMGGSGACQRRWRRSGRCWVGTCGLRSGCRSGPISGVHREPSMPTHAGWPSTCRSVNGSRSIPCARPAPRSRCSSES